MKPFKTYYGGKESSGVPQTIINHIPPHSLFCEAFGGNYTLSRYINTLKKWVNDKSEKVFGLYPKPSTEFYFSNLDYKKLTRLLPYRRLKIFLYLDPPYLLKTRSSQRKVYDQEMTTPEEHKEFLIYVLIYQDKFNIAISHYPCDLYDDLLFANGWYYIDYVSQTRSGQRKERLYMNYDPKSLNELQDYRYLGKDNNDRQRIKRRIKLLEKKLKELPPLERAAVVKSIKDRY